MGKCQIKYRPPHKNKHFFPVQLQRVDLCGNAGSLPRLSAALAQSAFDFMYKSTECCRDPANTPVLKCLFPLQATECEHHHHLFICCRKEKTYVGKHPADKWLYGGAF